MQKFRILHVNKHAFKKAWIILKSHSTTHFLKDFLKCLLIRMFACETIEVVFGITLWLDVARKYGNYDVVTVYE